MTDESIRKPTADKVSELLEQLSVDQIRFIIARQDFSSDKATAEKLDISPHTVKDWKQKGIPVDEAVRCLAIESVAVAKELRKRVVAKAMTVKASGLDSDSERIRQNAATEIIEWELGKARQAHEFTGTDGGPIEIEQQPFNLSSLDDDELETLAKLARRIAGGD